METITMNFLQFIKKETTRPLHRIITMAALSGISNAVLLAVINAATQVASYDKLNFRYFLLFFVTIILFIVCQKYILHEITIVTEEIIAGVRVRLSDKIRRAYILSLEQIDRSQIYNRLTQETMVVSNSAPLVVMAVQSGIMLFFVSIYILILSKTAFFLILILLAAGVLFYLRNHKRLEAALQESNQSEMAFFESLTDVMEGMKEIKFNQKKSSALINFLNNIVSTLKNLRIRTGIEYLNNTIFAQSFYYFLIGVIVFILPRLFPTYTEVLGQLTAAILFMIGPVGAIIALVQSFDQVNFAVENISRLEMVLERLIEIGKDHPQYNNQLKDIRSFNKISLKDLEFSYKDQFGNDSFSIGPFNFDIQAGETLFVVGGNGSGKTTFIKVLSMLYYPDKGSISLDDIEIGPFNVVDYRELFSAVFSDSHLFSKLYGMEDVNREKVNELLKIMEIHHKTQLLEDRFSTIDLSTGQRKRLALLISLLEDKPIYIFDEWAADQDPEFRHYFYEVILKKLKEEGKTIIAASHDDRFFHHADRVIKLDYGKVNDFGDSLQEGQK